MEKTMEILALLALHLLFTFGMVHSQVPDNVVWTKPTATFWKGETNTNLICKFRGQPIAVYWMKGETPSTADILVSWYGGTTSGIGVQQGTHTINNDFSLGFSQPALSDTGRYICRVSNHMAYLIYNHTDLRVLDPVLNIVDTLPNITEWKGETVVLPCDFSVTPLRLNWNIQIPTGASSSLQTVLTYADGIYNVLGGNRYWWSDNFALVIWGLEVQDEATFTCVVQLNDRTELRNSTELTVYARAEEPFVQIEGCGASTQKGQCLRNVKRSQDHVDLVCAVKGAKPSVSLVWVEGALGYEPLNDAIIEVRKCDGEYDTTLTMRRDLSKITGGETFTCVASGMAVNGTSNQTVILHYETVTGSESHNSAAAVVIPVLLMILLIVAALVIFALVKTGRWNPFFLRRLTGKGDKLAEEVPLSEIAAKRKEIRDYKPGKFLSIDQPPASLNIGLFGVLAAGKSAFVNSLIYSFTGKFGDETNESDEMKEGSQTKFREKQSISNGIQIVDNKGLQDYDLVIIPELMAQIEGRRGIEPQNKVKSGVEIHTPVLISNMSSGPGNMVDIVGTFARAFSAKVTGYYGRHIMIVITHKDSLENAESIKEKLSTLSNIPVKQIWLFENYTMKNHVEDEENTIHFLDFVLACLELGERNVNFQQQREKEIPEKKGLLGKINDIV